MHSCGSSCANKRAKVAEAASNLTADAYAQLLKQIRKQESESFAYDGKGRALHARMYILRRRKEKKKIEQRRTNKKGIIKNATLRWHFLWIGNGRETRFLL